MRFVLLIICCVLSITASAQFWKKKVPNFPRYAQLDTLSWSTAIYVSNMQLNMPDVYYVPFQRSVYELIIAEDGILKQAKHNMHYRVYNLASYNFSDLADLYILQNRFSEAKWYLLQSNALSVELKDDKHTIANLLTLAAVKSAIGEPTLAKLDLQQARELANSNGLTADVKEIEKRIHDLNFNKTLSPKAELRYAEAVEANNKAKL